MRTRALGGKTKSSRWAKRLREPTVDAPEPAVRGAEVETVAHFFAALRRALPRDGIVCADSGLHQQLLRRHFEVLAPRGLLFPSDYQSMGFGLPAAIGAKLAVPGASGRRGARRRRLRHVRARAPHRGTRKHLTHRDRLQRRTARSYSTRATRRSRQDEQRRTLEPRFRSLRTGRRRRATLSSTAIQS